MLYICDDITTDIDLLCSTALPPERRERALRYRQPMDRQLSAAAYLLLRHAIRIEYGIDITNDLSYTPAGKPYLANHPDINFSFSHCRGAVAVAIRRDAIGVDIERIDSYNADVAAYCCNTEEQQAISLANCPAEAFISLWTRKESLLKMRGAIATNSLKTMLQQCEAPFFSIVRHGYVCTVCGADAISTNIISISDLISDYAS